MISEGPGLHNLFFFLLNSSNADKNIFFFEAGKKKRIGKKVEHRGE